jgi:zinc protease
VPGAGRGVLLAAALVLAWPSGPGAAARQRGAMQAPPPARSAPLAEAAPLTSKVLANGLEIVVFEDHTVPLVTIELAVRNGSFTEPPELNGLSHLYEHMFFKTNRAMVEGADCLKDFGQLGISYNGTTREEVVEYYFTTITPNFPVAMRYIRDAVRFPVFDEREFAKEQEVVVGELRNHESNPFQDLSEAMTAGLFYKYPSRKTPGGNLDTVRAATTTTMRTIKERYYVPNNSAVVLAGDVSPQAAFLVADGLFADWPKRTPDPFVEFPLVEHPPLPRSDASILRKPIQNVVVEVGWQGPSIGKDDAATYAADVFSRILDQPDGRFQRALVDSGLATVAGIGYYTQRNVGPITLILQTTADKARAAVKTVYSEIAAFNTPGYYTDEQLESAKAALEVEDLFDREKPSEYSHTVGFWWASTGLDYFRGYLKRLRDTSRADVTRYTSTYIQGKPHIALAMLSDTAARMSGLTVEDLVGPATPSTAGGRQ